MTDGRKTKTEILAELQQLRQRMADLEAAASGTPGAPAIDVLTKYQLLAAVARDVILFVRARDGRILEANHAAEETYGYSRAELLGLTIYDLRAPSTRSGIAAQMNQADLQGVTFETRHRRRDGYEFPVEVNSGGITLGSERILLSIVRDITERKRAESQKEATLEALRQSEERFSKSFFNAPVALSLTRVADGCFFEVNERFTELFEFSRAELIGRTSLELEMYPHPEERAELLKQLGAQGFVRDYELTVRARSGTLRQTLVSIVAVKLNEEDCLLATIIDITERKQMELALQELNTTLEERVQARTAELQIAANRLRELDRLKDDFISRINHELRTPLANVQLHVELLRTGKPERQEQYLQVLQRETQRLRVLIEDLLKINQLTSDLIEVEPQTADLNELINGHLPVWRELAAQHGLEFKADLAVDLPGMLIDPDLIVQVIAQLVHNAVNYTVRGTITLATARQQQDGRAWITLSVSDTGPGIAPDELPHIFERFYRGRAAANYKTPGTGVGLSISRDIISLLDGQIVVESEVNRGSTFTCWLPIALAE